MAALTPLTWHFITLAAITSPTYPIPNEQIPGGILDFIVGATSFPVFCTSADGTHSVFVAAAFGTTPVRIRNGAITINSTPAMDTQVMDSGANWYSIRGGASPEWYWYDDALGIAQTLSDSSVLGAFIS